MADDQRSALILPALRAHMGDWMYYVSFLRMSDVAERISIAEDIHSGQSLRELLQRRLSDRASKIKDYLIAQPQRFFNALVVATYGGKPSWHELTVRTRGVEALLDPETWPEYMEGALGILTLDGSEKLFAVDGQHRVAGIREAVKESKELGNEEICVIFVPGVTQERRAEDQAGFERTRRLFTTLNRYAKAVSKTDIIALDEDDVVAITTRRLIDDKYPLFHEKISLSQSKNIPVSDKTSLTTITALYDVIDIYFRQKNRWSEFKKLRPPDEEVERFYERAVELWDELTSQHPPLQELKSSDATDEVAAKYRGDQGGYLLFRPIGLIILTKVIRHLMDNSTPMQAAVQRTSRVSMALNEIPWVGILWDAANQRMITAPENQRVAELLFVHAVGGNLSRYRTDAKKLREEYAGLLNIQVENVQLPPKL